MRIAVFASEVVPFAKTGGLADVTGALAVALGEKKQDIIIIMPCYKEISKKRLVLKRVNADISCAVIGDNIKVYFIESEKYFNRDGLYQDKSRDYSDNLERFAYYCRRSLHLLKEISFKPDVIHVHDWQASLIPVYLKTVYSHDQFYKNTPTVLTLHNLGYQGFFPKDEFLKLGLDRSLFDVEGLEFYGKINLLKGGIVFADLINTVSPTYAKEIMTQEFGFGLEGVLNKRADAISGILNGLDYSIWNPENDKLICANFSSSDLSGKEKNKKDLRRLCNLPDLKETPLVGIVSRIAQQKGFDILLDSIEEICNMGIQIVILGVGDFKYHTLLKEAAKKYPECISLNLKFDNSLAHKIYAGSDIFLMPSKYEPCGLGQMIALRYATVPVVFNTGGLADTVNSGNGFIFNSYTKVDLIKVIKKAALNYSDKKKWNALILRGMNSDFSWDASAKEYLKLYEKAKNE
ncbi:MAG: glycogen synthase GlgA [Candidatus Omnitrophica bacterium]|nr:glycogen synthase GlgA [Candidatus Omnitrophota bacterium]